MSTPPCAESRSILQSQSRFPCDLGSQAGVDTMLAQTPDELDAIYICHGISNTQETATRCRYS